MNDILQTNISFVECCIAICYKSTYVSTFERYFCAYVKLGTKISMKIWVKLIGLTDLSDVGNTGSVLIRVS